MGWAQHAYEVEIVRAGVTETVVAASDDQVLVEWPVAPLATRERAAIRVRLADADGVWSGWSAATVVEAGLLDPADWTAKPVGAAWDEDPESDDRRPSLVRREFHVADDLVSARLYVTAHGLYEAEVNGFRVGDDTLSPGWTVYPKRLRYYTYDVTDLIAAGRERDRRVARRRLVPRPARLARWLPQPVRRRPLVPRSARADLRRRHRETVATDDPGRPPPRRSLRTGIYDGETYDARLEPTGWSLPGFDDEGWAPSPSATATRARSSPRRLRRCAAPRRSGPSRC